MVQTMCHVMMTSFVFVTFLCTLSDGYSQFLRTGLSEWSSPSRRSWCVGAEGRCYTTGQCCDGYVCAAFGDVYGQNPEVPGYCVKQKELRTCTTDMDCSGRFVCADLLHSVDRYCVPGHTHPMAINVVANEEPSPSRNRYTKPKAQNGLTHPCLDDTDCASHTEEGERLCCQEIRRYRQKPRKICDRITPISMCIAANNAVKHPGK